MMLRPLGHNADRGSRLKRRQWVHGDADVICSTSEVVVECDRHREANGQCEGAYRALSAPPSPIGISRSIITFLTFHYRVR